VKTQHAPRHARCKRRRARCQREKETTMTTFTIHALPLPVLRDRARKVRSILGDARRGLARVGGLSQLDAALDATESLLPGLMDRAARDATMDIVRRADRTGRGRLKHAVMARHALPRAFEQELADVAPGAILEAIERVDICEALSAEVMGVLRLLERGCRVA
jgi:hypothetical protein